MTETIKNMDSLYTNREKEFYNRYFKKIYKGRIAKATDRKYSLGEYEKQFRFEIEFPLVANDYFNGFITFFENHNKIGHSISSTIRLLRKTKSKEDNDRSAFTSAPDNSSKEEIQFIKKIGAKETGISIDNDVSDFKRKWNKPFSQMSDINIVTEYAAWKAKKRFCEFLHTEFLQLQSPENITETGEPEISVLKNKDHTTRRQTLAIHYLDSHFKINREGKDAALGRFIQFLTDKNIDNIIKTLRNPLKNSEKKKIRADEELLKDLKYIRIYFEDLGLTAIIKQIDKDIAAISEDLE